MADVYAELDAAGDPAALALFTAQRRINEVRLTVEDAVTAAGPTRELALVLTKLDEAGLWLREDVERRLREVAG